MIVNGKSVRGLYTYAETVDFEKDDFVVYGNSIYVCTSNFRGSNANDTPANHPECFEIYLAEKIATPEDFYEYANYLENRNSYKEVPEDKLINASTLYYILRRSCFGLSTTGIIDGSVIYNSPNGNIEYSINSIKETITWETSDDLKNIRVLDTILGGKNLNYGMLKISRNLPEIKDLKFIPNLNADSSNYLILKQYTYMDDIIDSKSPVKCRIQELIDPSTGYTYYRYCEGSIESDEWVFKNPSIWKRSFIDNDELSSELSSIENIVNPNQNNNNG